MRALPSNALERSGTIHLGADDLRALPPVAMTAIRGRRIGMVFQLSLIHI